MSAGQVIHEIPNDFLDLVAYDPRVPYSLRDACFEKGWMLGYSMKPPPDTTNRTPLWDQLYEAYEKEIGDLR